jgi:hypothetical protein
MPEHELGHYTGRLLLQPLPDGRRMRVIEDFGFMEADGLHWPVPPKSTVDGASIPQVLWSLMGGPLGLSGISCGAERFDTIRPSPG